MFAATAMLDKPFDQESPTANRVHQGIVGVVMRDISILPDALAFRGYGEHPISPESARPWHPDHARPTRKPGKPPENLKTVQVPFPSPVPKSRSQVPFPSPVPKSRSMERWTPYRSGHTPARRPVAGTPGIRVRYGCRWPRRGSCREVAIHAPITPYRPGRGLKVGSADARKDGKRILIARWKRIRNWPGMGSGDGETCRYAWHRFSMRRIRSRDRVVDCGGGHGIGDP